MLKSLPIYNPKTIWAGADPGVVKGFSKALRDTKAPRKFWLALFEAGIVEANLKNPHGGDRDSVGSLQQRAGWGSVTERMDPYKAALRFLVDARKIDRKMYLSGKLAQAVQRSGFPLRYQQAYLAAAYVVTKAHGLEKGAKI